MNIMRTGQQGILLWNRSYKIGIDLFLSDVPGRLLKNVIKIENLLDVILLFGTHDHIDHIDRRLWTKLAHYNPKVHFVAPSFLENSLPEEIDIDAARFEFVDEGLTKDYQGIHIEAIPAAHEFVDVDEDGRHPYLIYVIEFDGKKICHMGDTCLYEGLYKKLRSYGRFDIIFLPINGRDAYRYTHDCIGNMTFQEAADLTGILAPKLAVPGHYDMFAHNSEDPKQYIDYVKAKYPGQEVSIMKPGLVYQV